MASSTSSSVLETLREADIKAQNTYLAAVAASGAAEAGVKQLKTIVAADDKFVESLTGIQGQLNQLLTVSQAALASISAAAKSAKTADTDTGKAADDIFALASATQQTSIEFQEAYTASMAEAGTDLQKSIKCAMDAAETAAGRADDVIVAAAKAVGHTAAANSLLTSISGGDVIKNMQGALQSASKAGDTAQAGAVKDAQTQTTALAKAEKDLSSAREKQSEAASTFEAAYSAYSQAEQALSPSSSGSSSSGSSSPSGSSSSSGTSGSAGAKAGASSAGTTKGGSDETD